MKLGAIVREYRLRNCMTMAELGNKLGVSAAAVSRYELGQRNIDPEILSKIVDVLCIPTEKIKDALLEEIQSTLPDTLQIDALAEDLLVRLRGSKKITAVFSLAEIAGYEFAFDRGKCKFLGMYGNYDVTNDDLIELVNGSADYVAYLCALLEKRKNAKKNQPPAAVSDET